MREVQEAEQAKTALDGFVSRLTAVCNTFTDRGEEVTHEAIEEAMDLTKDVTPASITWQVIQDLRMVEETRKKTSETEADFFGWLDLFLQKKDLSDGRMRSYKVLFRMLKRYQSFVRETDKERKGFTLNVHTIDRETIEDFFRLRSQREGVVGGIPRIV